MAEPNISKIFIPQIPELSKEEMARFKQIQAVRTFPRDERFPSQNQALHCWNLFNEWKLCSDTGGSNCQPIRQNAESCCPSMWIEEWEEGIEEGSFVGIGSRYIQYHNDKKHGGGH